ncbi:MAG: NAD-dependent epimerase/dehydratase family protein [archaeon]|nr:NAD-dependent epimerase/dehydratase family protein [archaeon]
MKVLVTGGAGFIGPYLVGALENEGHEVVVFDNFSNGDKERLENSSAEIVEGDIRNPQDLGEVIRGCELVFHLAAQSSVQKSLENPEEDREINVSGTRNVIAAAEKEGVKKIIFFSSAAVYGDTKDFPISEETVAMPISPYGESKLAAEKLCEKSSIPSFILRIFNIYGKGGQGVISKMLEEFNSENKIEIYGSGEQTRDFLYIKDLLNACILCIKTEPGNNMTLNIASGEETSINDIVSAIENALNTELNIERTGEREGDIQRSWTRIDRASEKIGYRPEYSIEEGIKDMLK